MQAYITRERSKTARFELAEIPTPLPSDGQIVIAVKATSLNPVDNLFLRADLGMNPDLPSVLHSDVAGVVSAIGPDITQFQVGDEVYACAGGFKGHGGALAQYMLADVRVVARKPQSLDFAQAAALPLVSITAWEGLIDRARLQLGQHVLVQGGTGGVGHVVVQLAKAKGARVATTISTDKKGQIASDLGADDLIYYHGESVKQYVKRLTNGQGFDIIFNTVDGQVLEESFKAIRKKGQVIHILGFKKHDVTMAFLNAATLHFQNMTLPLLTDVGRAHQGFILENIATLVDHGKIKPLLDPHRFTFAQANEAHALYESKKHVGKIVLESTNWA